MPNGGHNMDTKSGEQLLIVQSTIEANRQENDEKQMKTDEKSPEYHRRPQFFDSNHNINDGSD